MQFFKYSPISHLYHTGKHMYWDSRHNLFHIRYVLLVFKIPIDTHHYSIFVLNYIVYHQTDICINMKYVLQVFYKCFDSFVPFNISNLHLLLYGHIYSTERISNSITTSLPSHLSRLIING